MAAEDKTPCEWAADLVERLADSHTPPEKLRCVRDAMAERWESTTDLEDDDPERHLSAVEAASVLEDAFGADHGTVRKARQLIAVGHLEPPKPAEHPSKLIPPPPRGRAPIVPAPKEAEEGAGARTDGKAPGVVDLSVSVPTTGPKPVAPKPGKPPKQQAQAPKSVPPKPDKDSKPTETAPVTPPVAPLTVPAADPAKSGPPAVKNLVPATTPPVDDAPMG